MIYAICFIFIPSTMTILTELTQIVVSLYNVTKATLLTSAEAISTMIVFTDFIVELWLQVNAESRALLITTIIVAITFIGYRALNATLKANCTLKTISIEIIDATKTSLLVRLAMTLAYYTIHYSAMAITYIKKA